MRATWDHCEVTLLEEIIDGATNDLVSTSNLLRKVQVASHRLGANELEAWSKRELSGFGVDDTLPLYRADIPTPVLGTWLGPAGKILNDPLSLAGLPEGAEVLFQVNLRQPLAELEALADGSSEPQVLWSGEAVGLYNRLADEGVVSKYAYMSLGAAHQVLPRTLLRGVIDAIRNKALEFALDLQSIDPMAGSLDGPTIENAEVARVVNNFYYNINGHGTNIAHGNGNHLESTTVFNDVEELVAAAQALGLEEDALSELRAAAEAPEDVRASKLETVVQRIAVGSLGLAKGVAASVAANGLASLIAQFLG